MSKIEIKTSRQKVANILLSIGCVNINFKNKFLKEFLLGVKNLQRNK